MRPVKWPLGRRFIGLGVGEGRCSQKAAPGLALSLGGVLEGVGSRKAAPGWAPELGGGLGAGWGGGPGRALVSGMVRTSVTESVRFYTLRVH